VKHAEIDLATTLLGHTISMPVIAAPVGSLRTLWPRGEAVAARAVGDAGTISCLSTLTGTALEEVRAASSGPCWFQLYLVGGRDVAERAIARAKAAGYDALVLTIDTPVAGMRLRDLRNGSSQLISGSVWQKVPVCADDAAPSVMADELLRGWRVDAIPQHRAPGWSADALR
jgi:isopentenyl diphosphate isomerase/L-lactate dehydrogenase-like FMN-dependent dehydrogenase